MVQLRDALATADDDGVARSTLDDELAVACRPSSVLRLLVGSPPQAYVDTDAKATAAADAGTSASSPEPNHRHPRQDEAIATVANRAKPAQQRRPQTDRAGNLTSTHCRRVSLPHYASRKKALSEATMESASTQVQRCALVTRP